MWAPVRAGVGLRAQPHSRGLHPTPCSPAPSLSGCTPGRGLVNGPPGAPEPRVQELQPQLESAGPGDTHQPGCLAGLHLFWNLPSFVPSGHGDSHLGAWLGRAERRQWQDDKAWALGTPWDLEGQPLHSPGLTGRGELWSAPSGGVCLHTCQSQSRGHMLHSTVPPHPTGHKK